MCERERRGVLALASSHASIPIAPNVSSGGNVGDDGSFFDAYARLSYAFAMLLAVLFCCRPIRNSSFHFIFCPLRSLCLPPDRTALALPSVVGLLSSLATVLPYANECCLLPPAYCMSLSSCNRTIHGGIM